MVVQWICRWSSKGATDENFHVSRELTRRGRNEVQKGEDLMCMWKKWEHRVSHQLPYRMTHMPLVLRGRAKLLMLIPTGKSRGRVRLAGYSSSRLEHVVVGLGKHPGVPGSKYTDVSRALCNTDDSNCCPRESPKRQTSRCRARVKVVVKSWRLHKQ